MAGVNRGIGWVFGIGAALIGVGALIFGATGKDPVEEEIDKVVKILNHKLGRTWGRLAFGALEAALGTAGAGSLISLARAVHEVEQVSSRMGWNGIQKRAEVRKRIGR